MAMVQAVSYNFSTVENPLSDGGAFSTVADANFTGSLKAIAGNLCEPVAVATACASVYSAAIAAPGGTWPADQYTEVTLTTFNGGGVASFVYLFVRQGSAASGTQYLFSMGGVATTFSLFAVVSGTVHTLVSATSITAAQGDVWRLSITGNVLSWSRNGTVIGTFTDTNNFVASGSPAFGLQATATSIADAQTALWAAGANQAATPTFSPNGGSFGPTQTVTISSATPGGTIYYTTDGSTPTHSSSSISNGGTISVAATATVKAIESVANFLDSAVGSASFTINGAVTTSTFSPVAGSYTSAQSVTLLNADSALTGFAQYYTTDGSTPTTGSTLYSSPISVSVSQTIKVLATATNYSNSSVASASYVIGTVGSHYSVPDARNYGNFPNLSTNVNGTLTYTVPKVYSLKYWFDVLFNRTQPLPEDCRAAGAPVASGTYPQNSRAPGVNGPNN
jgi:hypothetical protein